MAAKQIFHVPRRGNGGDTDLLLGVEKGGLLWMECLSATAQGPEAHPTQDVGEQMRDILDQLDRLLRRAGGSPQDVMKTVDFLLPVGLPAYRATADVRRTYFQGHFPASTGILMEALPQEGALMGVDVVAHIGPGERRETVPADERARRLTFRAGVEKDGILWLSGTTGRRFDPAAGAEVYPADLATQVEVIYEKQRQVLQELGYSYADVVKTVDYFTAAALPIYRQTAETRRRFFGTTFPVSTGVGVNRLLRPEALIEIDMVAVKGPREVINPGWEHYRRRTYVPAIRVNNLLFMSGFAAQDPVRNEIVGVGDLAAQAEQAYLQVATVVEAAGGTLADVVKVVEYLAPAALQQRERLEPVRQRFLQEGEYALSQPVVQRLVQREMLIEVEAVAVLG
jgi:enamine deaminase RidA (YjgF/YER057c/UK114 family)